LHAAPGSGAALIEQLGWWLYAGAGVIFLGVFALAIAAVFGKPRPVNAKRWILGAGVIFPLVTLTVILVNALAIGNALEHGAHENALRVHVVGKQWWWEVRYDDPASAVLANEIRIPAGRDVELLLSTGDVIHSFWVPALAGKVDMIPGRTNRLLVRADEPGIFRGQCAEYCGGQHAWMALYVVVETPADFDAWLAQQAAPLSPESTNAEGFDLFLRGQCQRCHALRGTEASGTIGPDLTHVGSRHSLAAGMLRNHVGTMAGWIAGAQDVKPGNAMPSILDYTGRDLRVLAEWLTTLE
jgi:cytochrome c oxidase subunit 2